MDPPGAQTTNFPKESWPFAAVPPTLTEAQSRVAAWIVEPPGIVLSYAKDVSVDAEVAAFVANQCDAALRVALPNRAPYIFVHDFTRAEGYTTEGRKVLTEWGVRIRKDVRATVVIAPHDAPLIRMGLGAASAVLRAAGIEVHSGESIGSVVAKFTLRPHRAP